VTGLKIWLAEMLFRIQEKRAPSTTTTDVSPVCVSFQSSPTFWTRQRLRRTNGERFFARARQQRAAGPVITDRGRITPDLLSTLTKRRAAPPPIPAVTEFLRGAAAIGRSSRAAAVIETARGRRGRIRTGWRADVCRTDCWRTPGLTWLHTSYSKFRSLSAHTGVRKLAHCARGGLDSPRIRKPQCVHISPCADPHRYLDVKFDRKLGYCWQNVRSICAKEWRVCRGSAPLGCGRGWPGDP